MKLRKLSVDRKNKKKGNKEKKQNLTILRMKKIEKKCKNCTKIQIKPFTRHKQSNERKKEQKGKQEEIKINGQMGRKRRPIIIELR